jgi:hypothetical protein
MRRLAATALAISAGVLRTCSKHESVVLSVEGADIRAIYEFGEGFLNAPEMKAIVKSQRQLRDTICAAMAEHRTKRCPLCRTRLRNRKLTARGGSKSVRRLHR